MQSRPSHSFRECRPRFPWYESECSGKAQYSPVCTEEWVSGILVSEKIFFKILIFLTVHVPVPVPVPGVSVIMETAAPQWQLIDSIAAPNEFLTTCLMIDWSTFSPQKPLNLMFFQRPLAKLRVLQHQAVITT